MWLAGFGGRLWFLIEWPTLLVLLVAMRVGARALSRRLTPTERCLVIGDGPTCARVRSKLESTPVLHARVVMQVPIGGLGDDDQSLAALAIKEDLDALTSDYRIDRIIIAPELAEADDVLNVIRAATSVGIKVSVVPRLLEVIGSSVEFDDVEGIPLLSMRSVGLTRSSWAVKRTLDVLVSCCASLVLLPLLAFSALMVKLDSAARRPSG